MKKIFTINRYDRFSDGKFRIAETFTTDSPYWEVWQGQIFSRSGYTINVRKMCMSECEALENNCGCYYKIVNEGIEKEV